MRHALEFTLTAAWAASCALAAWPVDARSFEYLSAGDGQAISAGTSTGESGVSTMSAAVARNTADAELAPIELQGVHNFRDVGGYTSVYGGTIRKGLLYRSADLGDMTSADRAQLHVLGIRYEYDLRNPEERAARPTKWGSDRPTIFTPFTSLYVPDPPQLPKDMPIGEAYAYLASAQAASLAKILRNLATERQPALIHCAAGNDRTGVTIAILMKILGVSEDQIVHEYLRSNEYWRSVDPTDPGLSADAIPTLFKTIDAHYNSFDNYVKQGLQLEYQDVQRLRKRYLGNSNRRLKQAE
jgi:protein-tyrosine phosphatase